MLFSNQTLQPGKSLSYMPPTEDYFTKVQKNSRIFTTVERIPLKIFKTSQECSQ